MSRRYRRRSIEDRFWEKVDKAAANGCWEWSAHRFQGTGYGYFWRDRGEPAHRVAYELLVGPIPDGLHLDHLCRNHACVNPAHLEPVTCRINTLRGRGPSALNAQKTKCLNSHPLDAENTMVLPDGRRQCRECARERTRRWRARNR